MVSINMNNSTLRRLEQEARDRLAGSSQRSLAEHGGSPSEIRRRPARAAEDGGGTPDGSGLRGKARETRHRPNS